MIFRNFLNQLTFVLLVKNRKNDNESYPMIVYNDWIGVNIIFKGYYEKSLIDTILSSISENSFDSNVIDVGANIGNHSIIYSKKFSNVMAFEPQKRTFKILQMNTSKIKNIEVFNYGLSEIDKKIKFFIPYSNNGAASKLNKEYSYEEKVILKNYDKIFDLPCSYIKIDVEGSELDVLKSMSSTINKYLPIISIEFNSDVDSKKMLIDFLVSNLKYENFYIKKEYNLLKNESSNFLIKGIRFFCVFLLNYQKNRPLTKISIEKILSSKVDYSLITITNSKSKYSIKA